MSDTSFSFQFQPYLVDGLKEGEVEFLVNFTEKIETFSDKKKLKDYICSLFNLKEA